MILIAKTPYRLSSYSKHHLGQIELDQTPERADSRPHSCCLNGNPPSATNSTVPQYTQGSALVMLFMNSASSILSVSLTSLVVK